LASSISSCSASGWVRGTIDQQVMDARLRPRPQTGPLDEDLHVGPFSRVDRHVVAQREAEPERGKVPQQVAHHGGHPGRADRGEVGDGERAVTPSSQVGDHGLEAAEPVEELVDPPGQRQSGGGRLDAPPGAGHQGESGLALERGEVLADRRRGVAEVGGGGVDRSGGDDRAEDPQPVDIEHDPDHTAELTNRIGTLVCA
jgi:hypothetical protein